MISSKPIWRKINFNHGKIMVEVFYFEVIELKCYINGYLHSMIDENHACYQMATNDGIITHFDEDVDLSLCDEIIDLKGGHLYPGFSDAHLHMLGYGEFLSMIKLFGCDTKEDVINVLLEYKDKPFIMGLGYIDVGLTKDDLDEYFKDQIVLLRHNDYHSLTVNSKALNYFQIKDETGILKENKAIELMNKLPKHGFKELISFLEASIKQLYQFGITGGHTDDLFYYNGFDETYKVFQEVLNNYPFRAHLLIHHEVVNDFLKSKLPWGVQNDYLELGSIKLFYDGTLSSKTALMNKPYLGTNSQGEVVMGKNQFRDKLIKMRELGLTVAVHVIGDLGLDEVVDLLTLYPPKKGQRDRIIHAPWAMKKTVKKMIGLPITIDIQPQFLASDLPRVLDYLSEKPELIFPWKTYINHGIILSGSSDTPVEIPNPLIGIKDAVFRKSFVNQKVYEKNESLSLYEAVKLYTTNSHQSSLVSNRGYLKQGNLADFTVFNANLFKLNESDFNQVHVTMTIVSEQIVYEVS